MGNLRSFAERELSMIGYDSDDDGINSLMKKSVLELIDTFSSQGHSGGSAPECVRLFERLALFKPLGPITCSDEEWMEVDKNMYQNKRESAVFKDGKDGKPYYLDAIIWREENGACFTGKVNGITSRQTIKIPFTPKSFYVDISSDRKIKNIEDLQKVFEYYESPSFLP